MMQSFISSNRNVDGIISVSASELRTYGELASDFPDAALESDIRLAIQKIEAYTGIDITAKNRIAFSEVRKSFDDNVEVIVIPNSPFDTITSIETNGASPEAVQYVSNYDPKSQFVRVTSGATLGQAVRIVYATRGIRTGDYGDAMLINCIKQVAMYFIDNKLQHLDNKIRGILNTNLTEVLNYYSLFDLYNRLYSKDEYNNRSYEEGSRYGINSYD